MKSPSKYHRRGARIPPGVLLVGRPEAGKTLLARTVAGEAAVPFFAVSASEIWEIFVGEGASRVRSLFEEAKTAAPAIIFIDEMGEDYSFAVIELVVNSDGNDEGTYIGAA